MLKFTEFCRVGERILFERTSRERTTIPYKREANPAVLRALTLRIFANALEHSYHALIASNKLIPELGLRYSVIAKRVLISIVLTDVLMMWLITTNSKNNKKHCEGLSFIVDDIEVISQQQAF